MEFVHPRSIDVTWRGRLWQGTVGERRRYRHSFGGPLGLSVRGFPKNERPLHRLITIDLADERLGVRIPNVKRLPLLYGFVYDGCVLDYEVVSDDDVRVVEFTPKKSSNSWPYKDYPREFAEVPLALGRAKRISHKKLTELTWQGLEETVVDQLVIVVRPNEQFGVSLWGEAGDAEMVEVIFCVQPMTGRVFVTNQCN